MALSEHLLQGSTSSGKRSWYGEVLVLFAVVTGCITVLVMSGSGQTLVAESSAIEVTRLREATVPTVTSLLRGWRRPILCLPSTLCSTGSRPG